MLCYNDFPSLFSIQDALELGAVFIGSENHSYSVSERSDKGARGCRWHCGIALHTPDRQFVFMCEQEQEQKEWLEAFRKVISQPMTAEDYESERLTLKWNKVFGVNKHTANSNALSRCCAADEANLRRAK